jgi:transposase
MGINHIAKTILLNHIKQYHYSPVVCGRRRSLELEYVLERIFHVLTTGCQWSKLEVVGGSWKTVYHYFSEWSKANLFKHAHDDLVQFYVKTRGLSSDLIVDTSFIKNVFGRNCVGPSPFDRGRNATKVSVLTDKHGMPLSFSFHRGNRNDSRTLHHTLTKCSLDIRGKALYADKIYDTENCRSVLSNFGLTDRLSRKGTKVAPAENKTRIVVEHCFSWLDKFRRILVRYEGCVGRLRSFHYLAALQLIGRRVQPAGT